MRKRAIAATMLLTAAMAFTSCAKLYEEETTETLKLPQTDIEIPEDNPGTKCRTAIRRLDIKERTQCERM